MKSILPVLMFCVSLWSCPGALVGQAKPAPGDELTVELGDAVALPRIDTSELLAEANSDPTDPQAGVPTGDPIEAADGFHRALLRAALNQVKAGQMRRLDLVRLRVAMLSPAFRQQAEDLAVIQMAASGSANVPTDESGAIDRASIDWDAIIAFLEKLIPLIVQLIDIFSGVSVSIDLHGIDCGPLFAVIHVDGVPLATVYA